MEAIIMVLMVCFFSAAFISWISSISFRVDENRRAIKKLIEKQIFEEKRIKQKNKENGRPVSSTVPTSLEIESYFI